MKEKRIVAVFCRRDTIAKEALMQVVFGIEAIMPSLRRERRIGDGIVERLQRSILVEEERIGERALTSFDFGSRLTVEPHIHRRESGSGVIKLLPVYCDTVR